MSQQATATLTALMNERATTQWGFALAQMPTQSAVVNNPPGTLVASQIMLPDILSYRITRSQDLTSDSCTLTFADDVANRLSTNTSGKQSPIFYPGPIDKKILLYLGMKGQIYTGTPQFQDFVQAAALQFTGFVETDAASQAFTMLDKTVTLNDLTSQFRFQVYDTFPHTLWGDQTLSYFDATYNFYPIVNPANGNVDGKVWQTDGRMFTMTSNDPVWGATHVPIVAYVDMTGNTPQGTPVNADAVSIPTVPAHTGTCSEFDFDYSNGIITFHDSWLVSKGHGSGLPLGAAVSVQGNPTYMAPETMIRKLLVEKAGWSSTFIDLQTTNLLLPMFDGQDRSIWDCMNAIASMTSPRFVPWKIWADEVGVIHFYETNLDSPPRRFYIDGQSIFNANHEYTARNIRTVVRGDGTVAIAGTGTGSGSDQSVTSIAYDNRAIAEYGLTEPLLLTQDVTDSIRHLTPTQAVAHLNLLSQAVLYQVSRPTYTITADIKPDYLLQIADKVRYTDVHTGVDKEMEVIGMEKASDGKKATMSVTLEEYYETINMNLGVPAGVSYNDNGQGATIAPPNSAIIGAVQIGQTHPLYVFNNGDYTRDANNNPIVVTWDGTNLTDPMQFNYMLWSKAKAEGQGQNPWNYNNLPPLSQPWQGPDNGSYYVPNNNGTGGDGYTYCVGPDNIFYRYKNGTDPDNDGNTDYHINPEDVHDDATPPVDYTWIPPGNSGPPNNGKGYDAYVWAWWYLCLDSNATDPATGNPYYTEPFKEKNSRLLMRIHPTSDGQKVTVPDNGNVWVRKTWSGYPGPNSTSGVTKLYKNLVVGCSNYTTPPVGFVGANVLGDGVLTGVAYGNDANSSLTYVNYLKKTRGHLCLYAMDSDGGSQFLRIPFWLQL